MLQNDVFGFRALHSTRMRFLDMPGAFMLKFVHCTERGGELRDLRTIGQTENNGARFTTYNPEITMKRIITIIAALAVSAAFVATAQAGKPGGGGSPGAKPGGGMRFDKKSGIEDKSGDPAAEFKKL